MDIDPAWLETDFYAVLGVDADASAADLTKAYRRLARELHPDTNADPAAEDRFKAASAAYDVLRDPDKRAAYDQARRLATSGTRRRPGGGYTIRVDNFGGPDDFGIRDRRSRSVFDDLLDPSSRRRGSRQRTGGSRQGADLRAEVTIPFADAVAGTTAPVTAPGGGLVTVRIPAGVDDGQTIRVPRRGQGGGLGGPSGDLLVTVHVEPHHLFGRAGKDLTLTVPVTYAEAALGGAVTVPTLDGDSVTVRLPAGTPGGRVLRIPGRGVPTGTGRGDLLVTVRVDVPTDLSDHQRDLIRQLADHDRTDLRDHLEG